MGLVFRLTGLTDTVQGFAADCEANWLRETEPETWGKVRHYLGLSGFLTHRLVGRFVDSTAAQVGYLPFDNRHFAWAGPKDWKWTVAPVERAWLPDLVPPTAPLGEITAAAAAHTGLPEGLPVIAAAADKACEVLGSGAEMTSQRRMPWSMVSVLPSLAFPICMPRTRIPMVARIAVHV